MSCSKITIENATMCLKYMPLDDLMMLVILAAVCAMTVAATVGIFVATIKFIKSKDNTL